MKNEARDFPQLRKDEIYGFPCTTDRGIHYIKSSPGPIKMGITLIVSSDADGITHQTDDPKVVLQEVNIGDIIIEFDCSEKRVRMRLCEVIDYSTACGIVYTNGLNEIFLDPEVFLNLETLSPLEDGL